MKQELKLLGLTEGEINVYLALLKLGSATNSPIARHAHLQSSSVYYCLNSLIEKGFITYILKGNRKHFQAVNPEVIPRILEEQERVLKNKRKRILQVIPRLKQYQSLEREKTTAEVYEGFQGFRAIFRQIIQEVKRGGQYEAFVIEQSLTEPREIRTLFKNHNRELKMKGVKLRLLAHESFRDIFEKMYGRKFLKTYQEIRYASQFTPVGITIYNNHVITHLQEQGKPISIKVTNAKLASMYRAYFNEVWKQARA